jgi:acyl dehydratase
MAALSTYAKAIGGALPVVQGLPFVPGGTKEVPSAVLQAEGVRPTVGELEAYDRVCGFPLRDALPPTFPHMQAFRLQMELMTRGDFPVTPLGLVHTVNRITQHRPLQLGEAFDLNVRAMPIERVPAGRQITLVSEASVGSELVWEDASTYLARGGGEGERAPSGDRDADVELRTQSTWRLPADLGRRYGRVSGDVNPIHINPYAARAFGFPRAIAHGMWTKARCLAALDDQLPGALGVEVRFRKPILLPSSVAFAADADGRRFRVTDAKGAGTVHLTGSVRGL